MSALVSAGIVCSVAIHILAMAPLPSASKNVAQFALRSWPLDRAVA
jgi:hypothetical protein